MSKVIASLCNMSSLAASGLVFADMEIGVVRLLDMGLPEKVRTCTGLALEKERIYAVGVTAEDVYYLAVLAADSLAPLRFYRLERVRDVHSILVRGDEFYAVSTGTDAVLRYKLTQDGISNPVVAWQASGEGRDTHHVNSIASWNGEVVISAFGPKRGATWSTATEGYIYNLTQSHMVAEGIYQPHSLCAANGELYYCESALGRVYSLSGACLEVGGYVRGLAFPTSEQFVAGTSVARKVSKSIGIVNNPADTGEAAGACALVAYSMNADGAKKLAELSLAAFGSEIYDVLVLDWIDPVNHGNETELTGKLSNLLPVGEYTHLDLVKNLSELRHQMGVITCERDEVGRQLNPKEAEMVELEAKLEDARRKIAMQDGQLDHLAEQMELMTKELALAKHSIEELHTSTSWKVMAPLRQLVHWLRRI